LGKISISLEQYFRDGLIIFHCILTTGASGLSLLCY